MKIESNASSSVVTKANLADVVSGILNKRNKELEEASNKYIEIQNQTEHKGMIVDIRI